jgi:hypothetical protein
VQKGCVLVQSCSTVSRALINHENVSWFIYRFWCELLQYHCALVVASRGVFAGTLASPKTVLRGVEQRMRTYFAFLLPH